MTLEENLYKSLKKVKNLTGFGYKKTKDYLENHPETKARVYRGIKGAGLTAALITPNQAGSDQEFLNLAGKTLVGLTARKQLKNTIGENLSENMNTAIDATTYVLLGKLYLDGLLDSTGLDGVKDYLNQYRYRQALECGGIALPFRYARNVWRGFIDHFK